MDSGVCIIALDVAYGFGLKAPAPMDAGLAQMIMIQDGRRVPPLGRVAQRLAVPSKSVEEARSAFKENVFEKVWGRCLTFNGIKTARLLLIGSSS